MNIFIDLLQTMALLTIGILTGGYLQYHTGFWTKLVSRLSVILEK